MLQEKENPTPEKSVALLARPVVGPKQLIDIQDEIAELIRLALKPGRDYGAFGGVKNPSLLKPGAERLIRAFGCHVEFSVVSSEVDHDREIKWKKKNYSGVSYGLYRYVVSARIINNEGKTLAVSLGSASTLEAKYIDRPRDMENTVLKMAQKRAMVGAALNAFGLSDRFTQDMEDIVVHAEVVVEPPTSQKQEDKTFSLDDLFNDKVAEHTAWTSAWLEKNNIEKDLWMHIYIELSGRPIRDIGPVARKVVDQAKIEQEIPFEK